MSHGIMNYVQQLSIVRKGIEDYEKLGASIKLL